MTRCHFLFALALVITACDGVHVPPAVDSSAPGDAALRLDDAGSDAGILDANEPAPCAGFHGAVTDRAEIVGCAPNFRCPCSYVPIPDSCFDRLVTADTCEAIDQILADCGALDDSSPVCPFQDGGQDAG